VKILLDECVDRRFARELAGHEVGTVPQQGWAGIKNGDLLALAEKEFDAFITVDRKLRRSTTWRSSSFRSSCFAPGLTVSAEIHPLATELLEKLASAPIGQVTIVGT
jgi:hypothetical protein